MNKTEQRFREASGERYMQDGQRVRCHSQSKNKLKEWRTVHQDWTIPNDDIWPACQCQRAAIPGTFACNLHGGLTPSKDKPQSLLDIIPIDLGEKLKIIMENPDYISSRNDIMLMILRQWDLAEKLGEESGSKEDWDKINEANRLLKKGDLTKASVLMTSALESHKNKDDIWGEIYRVENVIKDLRTTETKVAKELRLMASAEQVQRLMDRIFTIIMRGIEKYVTDTSEQVRFTQYIIGEFTSVVNISPATIGGLLNAGSSEEV